MSAFVFDNIAVIGLGAMGGGMIRALLDRTTADTAAKKGLAKTLSGYDKAEHLTRAFYQEARQAGKALPIVGNDTNDNVFPTRLSQAIQANTSSQVVILVLQTQAQCHAICFGGGDDDNKNNNNDYAETLWQLLQPGACVILCSTVTAVWAQQAAKRFAENGVDFIDCPVSGGPVRARQGQLTLMASAGSATTCDAAASATATDEDESNRILERARPVLEALSTHDHNLHIIPGGAGMGSTAKMVHQLLAGVHVCVAAEALALAARAGLNVQQVYDIVVSAAGNSWMFVDRGSRMITNSNTNTTTPQQVKSQVQIFVKDLDIVQSEAKRLASPIPIAATALQQFISAVSLGLAQQDDSQVVQVYEKITGVSVSASASALPPTNRTATQSTTTSTSVSLSLSETPLVDTEKKEGTKVGDWWKVETSSTNDGTAAQPPQWEQIVEVGDEPRHHLVINNVYVRALRVNFPPNDTTLAHRHDQDSLYFFLVEGGLSVVNHVQGMNPVCDCMEFGEVRFGTHLSDQKPLVHKITNTTDKDMLCIDAEVLKSPPITSPLPLVAERHCLIKTRNKCRVYKLELAPATTTADNDDVHGGSGSSGGAVVTNVAYPFFHLVVVVQGGTIETHIGSDDNRTALKWTETLQTGHVMWKEPCLNVTKINRGDTTYIEYIAEWR